jgi:hypothetical protein
MKSPENPRQEDLDITDYPEVGSPDTKTPEGKKQILADLYMYLQEVENDEDSDKKERLIQDTKSKIAKLEEELGIENK